MQVAECRLALPGPALQWHQCDSECILVTLEIHLTTLFSEIFCFSDFFVMGRDVTNGQTHRRTKGHRDRQTFLRKYYFRLALGTVTVNRIGNLIRKYKARFELDFAIFMTPRCWKCESLIFENSRSHFRSQQSLITAFNGQKS